MELIRPGKRKVWVTANAVENTPLKRMRQQLESDRRKLREKVCLGSSKKASQQLEDDRHTSSKKASQKLKNDRPKKLENDRLGSSEKASQQLENG
ncbi:hypothetical protein MMC31_005799, partial [Peltigera leucophlebia]|nr:hypothetical protein [Peltigera leucophlebia]